MADKSGQSGGIPAVPVVISGGQWPSISALARDVNLTRWAVSYTLRKGGPRSKASLERRVEQWKARQAK
ncbi:hypothetical protein [Epibacterium ulvae]|uniref:hypothetical protein n=1 Tax=Epibacterium ulvae TaxID=1156985 RepID=UPI002491BE47|nr:hypothetical protein [Epibacterium ulvae]